MPISDDYVVYQDFAGAQRQEGWSVLVKQIDTFIKRIMRTCFFNDEESESNEEEEDDSDDTA